MKGQIFTHQAVENSWMEMSITAYGRIVLICSRDTSNIRGLRRNWDTLISMTVAPVCSIFPLFCCLVSKAQWDDSSQIKLAHTLNNVPHLDCATQCLNMRRKAHWISMCNLIVWNISGFRLLGLRPHSEHGDASQTQQQLYLVSGLYMLTFEKLYWGRMCMQRRAGG